MDCSEQKYAIADQGDIHQAPDTEILWRDRHLPAFQYLPGAHVDSRHHQSPDSERDGRLPAAGGLTHAFRRRSRLFFAHGAARNRSLGAFPGAHTAHLCFYVETSYVGDLADRLKSSAKFALLVLRVSYGVPKLAITAVSIMLLCLLFRIEPTATHRAARISS